MSISDAQAGIYFAAGPRQKTQQPSTRQAMALPLSAKSKDVMSDSGIAEIRDDKRAKILLKQALTAEDRQQSNWNLTHIYDSYYSPSKAPENHVVEELYQRAADAAATPAMAAKIADEARWNDQAGPMYHADRTAIRLSSTTKTALAVAEDIFKPTTNVREFLNSKIGLRRALALAPTAGEATAVALAAIRMAGDTHGLRDPEFHQIAREAGERAKVLPGFPSNTKSRDPQSNEEWRRFLDTDSNGTVESIEMESRLPTFKKKLKEKFADYLLYHLQETSNELRVLNTLWNTMSESSEINEYYNLSAGLSEKENDLSNKMSELSELNTKFQNGIEQIRTLGGDPALYENIRASIMKSTPIRSINKSKPVFSRDNNIQANQNHIRDLMSRLPGITQQISVKKPKHRAKFNAELLGRVKYLESLLPNAREVATNLQTAGSSEELGRLTTKLAETTKYLAEISGAIHSMEAELGEAKVQLTVLEERLRAKIAEIERKLAAEREVLASKNADLAKAERVVAELEFALATELDKLTRLTAPLT